MGIGVQPNCCKHEIISTWRSLSVRNDPATFSSDFKWYLSATGAGAFGNSNACIGVNGLSGHVFSVRTIASGPAQHQIFRVNLSDGGNLTPIYSLNANENCFGVVASPAHDKLFFPFYLQASPFGSKICSTDLSGGNYQVIKSYPISAGDVPHASSNIFYHYPSQKLFFVKTTNFHPILISLTLGGAETTLLDYGFIGQQFGVVNSISVTNEAVPTVFFVYPDVSGLLYRIRSCLADGSNLQTILTLPTAALIINLWVSDPERKVYFIRNLPTDGLHRMNYDGSQVERVGSMPSRRYVLGAGFTETRRPDWV